MEDNVMKGLMRGSSTGTLSQNTDDLIEKLSSAGSTKRQDHLSAMITLGSYIMNNGMIVPTQDLAKQYKELKGLKESTRLESSQIVEVLTKHLNVAQIYIDGKGYIIENHGKEINKVVESLQQIEERDQTVQ